MTGIVEFIGYAAAFWTTWKIFDGVWHAYTDTNVCRQCEKKRQKIMDLESLLMSQPESDSDLLRRIKKMQKELDQLRNSEKATSIVQFLNKTDKKRLEAVWGIGPVNSQVILDRRPYIDYDDARKKLNKTYFIQN